MSVPRNRIKLGRVRSEVSSIRAELEGEGEELPANVNRFLLRGMLRSGKNLSKIKGKQSSMMPK